MSTKCQYRMTNDTEWKKHFYVVVIFYRRLPQSIPSSLTRFHFPSSQSPFSYATCTSPIMHLIYPPPPPILHNLCFSFLLGDTAVPREIENNAYVKFWVANKVHYGRCASDVSTQKSLYGGDRWRALGHQVSTFWSQLPNGVIVLLQIIYNS